MRTLLGPSIAKRIALHEAEIARLKALDVGAVMFEVPDQFAGLQESEKLEVIEEAAQDLSLNLDRLRGVVSFVIEVAAITSIAGCSSEDDITEFLARELLGDVVDAGEVKH